MNPELAPWPRDRRRAALEPDSTRSGPKLPSCGGLTETPALLGAISLRGSAAELHSHRQQLGKLSSRLSSQNSLGRVAAPPPDRCQARSRAWPQARPLAAGLRPARGWQG